MFDDPADFEVQFLYQSTVDPSDPPPGENSTATNIDGTPCVALDPEGAALAIFQSEEAGRLRKVIPLPDRQFSLPWTQEGVEIRRTDRVSVAMGPNGVIYVGTRYRLNPAYGEEHGFVFAVQGFDPWFYAKPGEPPTLDGWFIYCNGCDRWHAMRQGRAAQRVRKILVILPLLCGVTAAGQEYVHERVAVYPQILRARLSESGEYVFSATTETTGEDRSHDLYVNGANYTAGLFDGWHKVRAVEVVPNGTLVWKAEYERDDNKKMTHV